MAHTPFVKKLGADLDLTDWSFVDVEKSGSKKFPIVSGAPKFRLTRVNSKTFDVLWRFERFEESANQKNYFILFDSFDPDPLQSAVITKISLVQAQGCTPGEVLWTGHFADETNFSFGLLVSGVQINLSTLTIRIQFEDDVSFSTSQSVWVTLIANYRTDSSDTPDMESFTTWRPWRPAGAEAADSSWVCIYPRASD
jgi:hypothetical protein